MNVYAAECTECYRHVVPVLSQDGRLICPRCHYGMRDPRPRPKGGGEVMLAGQAEPDIHLLGPDDRASTALRERYMAHLDTCFAEGHLPADEHDRRVTLAQTAQSKAFLAKLIYDLPPLPEPEPATAARARRWVRRTPGRRLAVYLAELAGALALAIVPVTTVSIYGWANMGGAALSVVTILGGAAWLIHTAVRMNGEYG